MKIKVCLLFNSLKEIYIYKTIIFRIFEIKWLKIKHIVEEMAMTMTMTTTMTWTMGSWESYQTETGAGAGAYLLECNPRRVSCFLVILVCFEYLFEPIITFAEPTIQSQRLIQSKALLELWTHCKV